MLCPRKITPSARLVLHRAFEVFVGRGRDVADEKTAAAFARRFTHAGEQFQKERIGEVQLPSLRTRRDDRDRAFRTDQASRCM